MDWHFGGDVHETPMSVDTLTKIAGEPDAGLMGIRQVSVLALCVAATSSTWLFSRSVSAHTAADFLPLTYSGYVSPFGFDGSETYTEVSVERFGEQAFAYLGSIGAGVAIVDITDTSRPETVGIFGADLDFVFDDVHVEGNRGYFSTTTAGTIIVDLETPAMPAFIGSVDSSNLGFDSVTNAWVSEELLFQVSETSSSIAIIDVSDPTSPTSVDRIDTQDSIGIYDLSVTNDRLYAAGLGGLSGEGATYVYDLQDIDQGEASSLGHIATGLNTASVWASSDETKLFVTHREAGGSASAWDISDLSKPQLIDSADASDVDVNAYSAGELFVLDDYAYTAWHQAGVQLIDLDLLDEVETITRIGAFGTSKASPLEMFVGNTSVDALGHGTVLLSDSRWGLYIVDATNVVDENPGVETICMGIPTGLYQLSDLENALATNGIIYGDADANGAVDFGDFLTLAANFGQSSTGFFGGDFDCSGEVGFSDFLLLAENFGLSRSNVSSVPEPVFSAWLLVPCTFFLRYRFLSRLCNLHHA